MTMAISEIMRQVELLSATEQEELAHKLMERARQRAASQSQNGQMPAVPVSPSAPVPVADQEDGEAEDDLITDVFRLNRVPPKRTYLARAKFHYVGRGKPRPYELDDDLLEAEERGEGEIG